MEALDLAVQLFLILVIVGFPVYCATRRFSFPKLNLISIPIICSAVALSAYWPHVYTDLRLELMNFNVNGISEAERVANVAPEMREIANTLYWSNMGVGWPLKAIFGMLLILPYPTIVWLCSFVLMKVKNAVSEKNT